jgi:hypothetical protein
MLFCLPWGRVEPPKFNIWLRNQPVFVTGKRLSGIEYWYSMNIYEKSESFRKYFEVIFLSLLILK